ncbi:MAG: hypothetical protein IJH67_03420 [Thermoguttaceae bacterium]|nr:hypothetical protein [Thermoguttaceae bacterium]
MSYIVATKEINYLVNKIKYREKRIAQLYREIHDMVSELEEFMGNATELIFRNRLILKRNDNSEILPIEIDVFSESITYCYHEIIEKQLESISQRKQKIRELEQEIEELVKVNEALRRNKKDLENQIQKTNVAIRHNTQTLESDIQSIEKQKTSNKITRKQENYITKLRFNLVFLIVFAISLVVALLLTATLREVFVVLLFSGLSGVSFGWWIYLFYTRQALEQLKDENTEKEFLLNKAIQTFENEKQLFEQEKARLKEFNETTVKTVNEKLQIARQQKEKYLAQEKEYQEKLAQLNEQFANLKEQIEAGEHAKRKADNLELDYKRLFEKYHNRESEIQTLQSDLNNSTNENKRLSSKIATLGAEIEKIQKQQENSHKEKQELERKCQYLKSHNASLENQNKDFQRQREDSQNNYSELEIEYKRIQTENQELERTVKKLNYQIPSLEKKNEKLQSQLETIQFKYSDLDNRIKLVQKEKQELENEKRTLNSQKKSLESENEKLQKQNNSIQSKYSNLNIDFKTVQNKNQTLKNENDRLDSQISFLKIEKEELLAENSVYVIENSKLKVQIQNLQEECLSLRNEKLDYNSNKKDYLNLQAKFNALQKENGELRYNLLKLDSKKAQDIIRRNSSDDELDNSSQSVPAETESATPTEDNRANSEQDLFYEIADEIIKKDSYSEEELIALYRRFNMSIFSGIAKINSWTDDVFGDVLIFEENKRFVIDPEIAAKVRNREVENEYN